MINYIFISILQSEYIYIYIFLYTTIDQYSISFMDIIYWCKNLFTESSSTDDVYGDRDNQRRQNAYFGGGFEHVKRVLESHVSRKRS